MSSPLLAHDIDEVLSVLAEKDAPNRLPLAVFRKNLPNLVNGDKGSNVLEWRKIAGGFYREVEIVDNDGNIVYVIPPLMSKQPTIIPTQPNTAMENVILEVRRMNHMSPERGEQLLKEAFRRKFGDGMKPNEEYINRWFSILKAEGYDVSEVEDTLQQTGTEKNANYGLENGFELE